MHLDQQSAHTTIYYCDTCENTGAISSSIIVERPQSRCTDPLLLIYSFQFRSAFRATTTPSQPRALDIVVRVDHTQNTPSQPQIRRPYKAPTSVVTDNLVKLIAV